MKYNYYTIKYISPASKTEVFNKTFGEISSALEWVKINYGYALREPYFEIYGYRYIFVPCKITLGELFRNNLIGNFVCDNYGGGGYYNYKSI